MKYLITLMLIVSLSCVILGYVLEVSFSEKLIGTGVVGIFFVVFPLFTYHRWKDKNAQDYMLTKENLDKMRNKK